MDVTYLQNNAALLIEHMRMDGYSKSFIKLCNSAANHVIREATQQAWSSYDDAREWLASTDHFSESTRDDFGFAINIIERFDVLHEFPHHPVDAYQMTRACHSAGKLDLFPLQEKMGEFEQALIDKGHRPEYIKSIKTIAAKIIINARVNIWNSFQDIQDYYEASSLSAFNKQMHRITIRKMKNFLNYGKVPSHRNSPYCIEDACPGIGKLDLYQLKERLPELEQYMDDHQYSHQYTRRVILRIERIIVLAGRIEWDSYQDVLDWFQSQDFGHAFITETRTIIRIMAAWQLFDTFPNNNEMPHPLWPRKNSYDKLGQVFRDIIDFGCEVQAKRGLKESSVHRARSEAASFFLAMQEQGCQRLEDISEATIIHYLRSGTTNNGRTKLPGLSLFMRDCIPQNPYEFRRLYGLIPIKYGSRKTVQFLTVEESNAFQTALEDLDNPLSLKQRAIGTLLFYTGMRGCDIANLKLESVDLQNHLLEFTQVKTGVEVRLPLLPVVGNAIYDYCTMERPSSESLFLFLGDFAPHHPITSKAVPWVVSKIMNLAGIRTNKGDRRGAHLFRHRAATVMAENNVPAPVISATLGHTSPKSLDSYLSADISHLRECAICIEGYEIPKEVFDIV